MKFLPVDVSSFSTMITNNYVYIDKTKDIYQLFARGGRLYFLSRPRRFGKTLLVSTLKELFLGNKKLFQNLWIGSSDYDWQEYPVIHLDFSVIGHRTVQQLETTLIKWLQNIARQYALELTDNQSPEDAFHELVVTLAQKNKVVILIDEYDKPILDHLHDLAKAEEIRTVLRSFYGIIKGLDPYLRAVFLTGVSRFGKTSLFSGLNNLNDISLKPEAATLLGYTQQEITSNFEPYLEEFAHKEATTAMNLLSQLQLWYNGYRFSAEDTKVYNPFSILYALHDKKFENYWFNSGTPTFLIHLIKQQYKFLATLDVTQLTYDGLSNFEIDNIPLVPLLYQTGYLTIDTYDASKNSYTLAFPNKEVELSFTRFLVNTLSNINPGVMDSALSQLLDALHNNNIEQFCDALTILFAQIPYTILKEEYYHLLLQYTLSLLSLEAQSEILTNVGRIDLVLQTKAYIYIFELKINKTPQVALQQIKDRRYYERYRGSGKTIILVGFAVNHKNNALVLEHIQEMIS